MPRPSFRLVRSLVCLACLGWSASAHAATPPDPSAITRAGQQTNEKFATTPSRWVVRCRLTPDDAIVVTVIADGQRRHESFAVVKNGRAIPVVQILELDGLWWVSEAGLTRKCRPYEARFLVPGIYFFKSLDVLRLITEDEQLASFNFQSREGDQLLYVKPVPEEAHALMRQAKDFSEEFKKASKTQSPEAKQKMARLDRLMADGSPVRIDASTGLIREIKLLDITMTVEEFTWLEQAPEDKFVAPNAAFYDDTPRWDHPNQWLMVNYDRNESVDNPRPLMDGCLLNLETGALRRIPYDGAAAMPLCFLADRSEVLVVGTAPYEGMRLVRINLTSGENTVVPIDGSGIPMAATLSPDGREVAMVFGFNGQGRMLDFQLRLLDLKSGKFGDLGKPARLGSPLSWLPDGSGIILKRFAPPKSFDAIEERIVCRLDRTGTLTDLLDGDTPVVLRNRRQILFERSREWFTCDFEGKNVTPYADGLKGHGAPAISPDEERIAFMHYVKGQMPLLKLFELGAAEGQRASQRPGLMFGALWR